MPRVLVPPIKCQGIKTKLVPLILKNVPSPIVGRWIEPFMGSGVVGLNVKPRRAVFADQNPHLVAFYDALRNGSITPESVRSFLEEEGALLFERGDDYYYYIRDRFNANGNPLDFLFLSRSCFNGMIRFNNKGEFNVPFCRKEARFSKAYITKIVNQVAAFRQVVAWRHWAFRCQDFLDTLMDAAEGDFIYCDPPYIGRHADYFNGWTDEDENRLFQLLVSTKARFILSTWHSNKYRSNEYVENLWSRFNIVTKDHFYHVGAKEVNRNAMKEALVMNFVPLCEHIRQSRTVQIQLFGTH